LLEAYKLIRFAKASIMGNFKQRWNLTTNWQIFVVILVFAITGSSAAILSKPILHWLGISKETHHIALYILLYILIIFPIYQILLIIIGFLFGQFKFFWAFEKKMLRSLKLGFVIDLLEKKKGTK
jgi:hypothetical protein